MDRPRKEGGKEGRREGGKEGRREGVSEGGRERGKEGGREGEGRGGTCPPLKKNEKINVCPLKVMQVSMHSYYLHVLAPSLPPPRYFLSSKFCPPHEGHIKV